jgi:hypothetical protein
LKVLLLLCTRMLRASVRSVDARQGRILVPVEHYLEYRGMKLNVGFMIVPKIWYRILFDR